MKLTQKEFEKLIKKVECSELDLHGTIAFELNEQFYTIGFYGECKDGFNLIVDEFLKKIKGEWMECEPTEYQRLVMQSKLIEKRKELEEQEAFESQEVPEDNDVNLGVSNKMFFRY
jgi:hypothetical protein